MGRPGLIAEAMARGVTNVVTFEAGSVRSDSIAYSWVSIDGTKVAVFVYQVGRFYFGEWGTDEDLYYFGAYK